MAISQGQAEAARQWIQVHIMYRAQRVNCKQDV